jgi:hypothetical protein
MQSLVVALAAWGQRRQGAAAPASTEAARAAELLRGARAAVRSLASPAADVLAGALERLCEEQEAVRGPEAEAGLDGPGRRGWLLAVLLDVGDGV